jgi:polyisoprenoid-binding protein YceI
MKTFLPVLLVGAMCLPALGQTPVPEIPTLAPPRALKYRFVPEQSSITFELPTSFHVIHGKIDAWRGNVEFDPTQPGKLKAKIEIRADSIETGKAKRDLEVRDHALEAARFPQIVFEGGTYKGNLSGFEAGATLTAEVSGTLTMHGVSKPIQTSIECAVLPEHIVVAGALPVFWRPFGLGDMSRFLVRVKDSMLVAFRLWAIPE